MACRSRTCPGARWSSHTFTHVCAPTQLNTCRYAGSGPPSSGKVTFADLLLFALERHWCLYYHCIAYTAALTRLCGSRLGFLLLCPRLSVPGVAPVCDASLSTISRQRGRTRSVAWKLRCHEAGSCGVHRRVLVDDRPAIPQRRPDSSSRYTCANRGIWWVYGFQDHVQPKSALVYLQHATVIPGYVNRYLAKLKVEFYLSYVDPALNYTECCLTRYFVPVNRVSYRHVTRSSMQGLVRTVTKSISVVLFVQQSRTR